MKTQLRFKPQIMWVSRVIEHKTCQIARLTTSIWSMHTLLSTPQMQAQVCGQIQPVTYSDSHSNRPWLLPKVARCWQRGQVHSCMGLPALSIIAQLFLATTAQATTRCQTSSQKVQDHPPNLHKLVSFSQPWKLPTQQAVSNKNQPYQFSWNPYWSQKSKNLRMTKVVLKHKTLLKTWNRQLQNCSSKTSHKALCPFSRPVKSVPRLSALSRLLQPIQTLELSGKQMKTESR